MYVRDEPVITLADVGDVLAVAPATWTGGAHQIHVNLDSGPNPTLAFGPHEVPATQEGIEAIATYFNVPSKFLARVERDEQQWILERRIERAPESDVSIQWTGAGISSLLKANQQRVDPRQIFDVAVGVLPTESPVVDWWVKVDDMRLDIIVPEAFDRGIGGDPKVGDITRGGLRFGHDRKRNLAPWVQGYLYRLACTNGMEMRDDSLRMDGRGATVQDMLDELTSSAHKAFNTIENSIQAFYDLRNQTVGPDRTGVLRRVAQEQGLPERTISHLEDSLPAYLLEDFNLGENDPVTMFHLVNLITNEANNSSLANRPGARRRLEQTGGTIVTDHAERCTFCNGRLN